MRPSVLRRRTKKAAAVLMAAAVAFVALARGLTLCLCDEDPDGCGHACHECGAPVPDGLSGGEPCLHLALAATDLAPSDARVGLPSVGAPPATPAAVAAPPPRGREVAPRETSPPPWIPSYCSYSHRLFPRS